jgi:hypothetical protein
MRDALPRRKLLHFLRYVCVVRVMEDSTVFLEFKDVELERIKICQGLIDLDPENERTYSEEIRILTRDAEVAALLRHVEESRIYVDEDGVRRVLQRELRDSYDRYARLLREPELDYKAAEIARLFAELLKDPRNDLKGLRLPASEREGLFESMYQSVLNQFVVGPQYGLDTYLSTRIRHGSLEGHLRSPLAVRDLLLPFSDEDESKGEGPASVWLDRLPGLAAEARSELVGLLRRFSRRVSVLISFLKDELVQVRSASKSNGAFDFRVNEEEHARLARSITAETPFDTFIDLLFARFWSQVESGQRCRRGGGWNWVA